MSREVLLGVTPLALSTVDWLNSKSMLVEPLGTGNTVRINPPVTAVGAQIGRW